MSLINNTFSLTRNDSQKILNNQTTNYSPKILEERKNSIYHIKESLKASKIIEPLDKYRSQIIPLEKELFANVNLQWGIDIISEDIPLIDKEHNNLYCHIVRTAHPDPNKENFILIHGFISCGLHFFPIIPYLIKRYNIFIPDTIGMGLSSRPQIEFTSPFQCEEYFISTYRLIIEYIFFKDNYNIKKEFYLCGHSIGGFIASRFMLKYPKGIKKVLLLSPVGITDYTIPGTGYGREIPCSLYCWSIIGPTFLWPCKIRVQNCYRCCCCRNMVLKDIATYVFMIYDEEIKRNEDGTKFEVNEDKIREILKQLYIISLEYPNDLYECAFYIFSPNPPYVLNPIEQKIIALNKIDTIIVYGENDMVDRVGAYRLQQHDKNKYKVFTIKHGNHSLALESPKELCVIIGQYF